MVARTYTSLPPIVDKWFQFLFHSPPGVLFTFPSRYLCTIGHQVVFSLIRWSGQIPAEFHVLCGTREYKLVRSVYFSLTRLSLSLADLSRSLQLSNRTITLKTAFLRHLYPTTPIVQHTQVITYYKFRLFPFRSPLLRESRCFIFLALLRCFSSGRSLSYPMYSDMNTMGLP